MAGEVMEDERGDEDNDNIAFLKRGESEADRISGGRWSWSWNWFHNFINEVTVASLGGGEGGRTAPGDTLQGGDTRRKNVCGQI